MPQPYTHSGRRLGAAVLVFVLCTILVVTLEPLHFRVPRRLHLMWWDGWFDVIANVALFMIPGFVFALARQVSAGDASTKRHRYDTLRQALIYGAAVSFAIETVQTFEPTRYPSLTDVASNSTGAAAGALIFLTISRYLRADSPLIGLLALEMPLMGLVYLLIPLCMLASLTLPPAAVSLSGFGLLTLALCIGTLLGHVQRYRFGPGKIAPPWRTALASGGAFLIGTMAAIPRHAELVAVGVISAIASAWYCGAAFVNPNAQSERRFEAKVLRRAAPLFAAYLALAAFTTPVGTRLSRASIIIDVESYTAFTVLGFLLAEWWGRLELRYRWVVLYVGSASLTAAIVSALLQRTPHVDVAVIAGCAIRTVAGIYGGWIYHLQRAHIRALVAARQGRKDEAPALSERALSFAARMAMSMLSLSRS